ncbi:GNAT family N-acetyltransferase [Thalassovita taeanensis]|uniref:L-ornithine N(alpha)-acyltransferase n=1 Tax=Thalassovita taeanensis TaxID=657014 RepID=A0A1H8ZBC9_9RHOB|nr:GNAT family N-acyltransferase [Thalassovita taeanensis]SEP61537.1 ornithine-acyl[acyl carrier protein] N-acyltransferase [Thalassovita taeanensis]
MTRTPPQFAVKLAETDEELMGAQRLRYHVFVEELGGGGTMVDHVAQLERDRFDPFFDHLILLDNALPGSVADRIVGVYRVLRDDQAVAAGQFYSEDEYDLSVLKDSGRKLLELGRSCLHPAYRGGAAMFHLWSALADYVSAHKIEILFGVASFHGTDLDRIAASLSMLHFNHLAPPDLRVRAREAHFARIDRVAPQDLDRRKAMLEVPALIKAYLRLGGFVGEGAYVDQAFNTTDVCLIMDTNRLNEKQKSIYSKGVGA